MIKKTYAFGVMSILFVFAFLSLTSAALTLNVPSPSPYETSFDIQVLSNQTEDVAIIIAPIEQDGDFVTFSDTFVSVTANASSTVTINYVIDSGFDFDFGETYTSTLTANGTASGISTKAVQFEEIDYCENTANEGDLEITIEDVNVLEGFGDDDDYWYLMDEIEVEVEVKNDGNWDVDNIEIEWAIYTTDGKKIMDDTLNDFNLKDGKDEVKTFTIILDENIDDFNGEDAVLYVSATGSIDDNDSPYDNEDTCSSDSVQAEVVTRDDFVILSDITLGEYELEDLYLRDETLFCGEEYTLNADVWNIGEDQQDEVIVTAYNKELMINEDIEIGDIDEFDNDQLSFTFELPTDLDEEEWYTIQLEVLDEDNDVFENNEDDKAQFDVKFKVSNCHVVVPPTISAKIESEKVIAGKEVIIKSTITNPGEKEAIYTLNVVDYEDWAILKSMNGDVLKLGAGESFDVFMTFDTKKDASGSQLFSIEVFSENELITSQPLGVTLKESRFDFKEFVKDNWKLIGIILLNLILVIAIIIVAVRIYRR